jgi:hypothetical protein
MKLTNRQLFAVLTVFAVLLFVLVLAFLLTKK